MGAVAAWAAALVIRGADVHTFDAARPRAEAVAVHDGRIVFVGDDADAAAWIGPGTQVLDAGGRVLIPGFVDAHVHLVDGGVELGQCALFELEAADAILAEVARCAAAGRGWVEGAGWSLPAFGPEGPGRAALDAVTGGRPALLWAADGHSAWVNTAALARAGVDGDTPDPPGGRIERGPDGAPSGVLRESATELVAARLPAPSRAVLDAGLERALGLASAAGITTALEAWTERASLAAFLRADRRGLPLRAVVALGYDETGDLRQLGWMRRARAASTRPRVVPRVVKLFVDGVIESRTAWMLDPYTDAGGSRGEPLWAPADLEEAVTAVAAAGFDVHVHAIGDGAVRATLDAMAAARAAGSTRPRFAIAHLEVIHPDDLPRFAALDVAAVFQPLWAWRDPYVTELTLPGLNPATSVALYPIGNLVRSGATVGFGSDWSVSSMEPMLGVEVAVTRQGTDDEPAPPLAPEQAISVEQAMRAATLGAAMAIGVDGDVGSITVGKAGDLVLLSADPWSIPARSLGDVGAVWTIAAGRRVAHGPATGGSQSLGGRGSNSMAIVP
jgi:predicted amidohydrolase YtcJ